MPINALILPPGMFRLLLAVVVVLDHTTPLHLGLAAVCLFFILSGYWVRLMWDREYASCPAPGTLFILSRVWRLMPVYYVALSTILFGRMLQGPSGLRFHGADTWTMLHLYVSHVLILGYALLPPDARFNGPAWSLDIELQFYVLAPWLMTTMRKYGLRSWPSVALFAAALAGLVMLIAFFPGFAATRTTLPLYLTFFLIGLVAADRNRRPAPGLSMASLGVATLLIIAVALGPATRSFLLNGGAAQPMQGAGSDMNILLALVLAPYALATTGRTPPFAVRIDRHCGNITYDIYVLHWPVLLAARHVYGPHMGAKQTVLTWLAVLLLSVAVYMAIDRPIDRRRTDFVRARRRDMQSGCMVRSAAG